MASETRGVGGRWEFSPECIVTQNSKNFISTAQFLVCIQMTDGRTNKIVNADGFTITHVCKL